MSKETIKPEELASFNWDDDEFFSEKEDTEIDENKKKKEDEEDDKKKKDEKKIDEKDDKKKIDEEDDEKEDKDVKFFEKSEINDEEESKNDEFYKNLALELKKANVFSNVEIKDDDEIDEDKFIELQDQEVDARFEEALEGFMEELDDDGKAFLKFKKDGGKTEDFFSVLKTKSALPKGDLDDEDFQEKIIRHYYSNYDDMTSDEIDDRIEWLKDTSKMESFATKYDTKIKDIITKKEAVKLKAQSEAKETQLKIDKKFADEIKSRIDKIEDVNGIPITPKDKKSLDSYMLKPTVKIGKNKFVSKFQSDLRKSLKDNDTFILLGKLLQSNFDLTDVIKNLNTKATRNIRKKLESQKGNSVIKNSGSSGKKSIADYFN